MPHRLPEVAKVPANKLQLASLHFISEQEIPKGQKRLTKNKSRKKYIRSKYWKIIAERTLVQQFSNGAIGEIVIFFWTYAALIITIVAVIVPKSKLS